jgi:nucleotide-binding universal stress UspA family protein
MKTDFTRIAVGLRSDGLHPGTLDAALNLSKIFKCTLHLICFDDNCNIYEDLISKKAQEGNVRFQIERRTKESAREIINAAKEMEADLLIIPADKKSQAIINDLEIPVLTIKENFGARPVRNIVMPIHDKPSTRQKIPVGTEIAKHFGAEINIIVVSGKNDEEQKRLKSYAHQAQKYITEHGVACNYFFQLGGEVDVETVKYAEEKNADMVVIMNDRDALFFQSSLSEKIIRNCDVPVLVVEPKDLAAKSVAGL